MLKIIDIYENLKQEEEVIFQFKNRCWLQLMAYEMLDIFAKDIWGDQLTFAPELSLKSTYFILGKWRDGMFELGLYPNGIRNYDNQVHICADTKEVESRNKLHIKMINEIIEVMDKYREYFVQKRFKFDDDFNIVKK